MSGAILPHPHTTLRTGTTLIFMIWKVIKIVIFVQNRFDVDARVSVFECGCRY
jgi:hypothetical protein